MTNCIILVAAGQVGRGNIYLCSSLLMSNFREWPRRSFPDRESLRAVWRPSPTTCRICPSTPSSCPWPCLSGTRSTSSWTSHYSLAHVAELGEIVTNVKYLQVLPYCQHYQMFSSALAHSQYYSTVDSWVSSCDMLILHCFILSATGQKQEIMLILYV